MNIIISNIGQIAKSTFTGGFWGAVGSFLSFASGGGQFLERLFKHSFSQAWLEGIRGGNMKHGFLAGAVSVAGGEVVGQNWSKAGKIAANSVIAGTATELGGGKFANGAITGAFSMMFNDMMHDIQTKRKNLAESAKREWNNKSNKWATKNNQPLCNVFAQDMMKENGMLPYEDRYLPAGEWADPAANIPGWEVVSDNTIQEGDVAAYKHQYSNATGHMGIVGYREDTPYLFYAGSSKTPDRIATSKMSYWTESYKMVIRRYVGKDKQ